jgi:hypothetical protein
MGGYSACFPEAATRRAGKFKVSGQFASDGPSSDRHRWGFCPPLSPFASE